MIDSVSGETCISWGQHITHNPPWVSAHSERPWRACITVSSSVFGNICQYESTANLTQSWLREKLVLLLKGYVFTIWQMTCIYSTLHNFNYKVVGSFIGNYHLPFVSSWPNVIFVIIYSPKSEFLSFVEVSIDFCGIFYTQHSMETNNSSQHSSRSLLLCSADVWNNLRVSKWRQNLNFGWIIPLICALKCEALKLL